MIILHGFGAQLGLPDASPFVLKVDAYLRLSGLPYKRRSGLENMRKAPKTKLPFITDDGEVISDSTFIIRHLQTKFGDDLDSHLNEQEKAIGLLVRSTLEEKLYWYTLYFRWTDEAGWARLKPVFFGKLPLVLRLFLPTLVRRDIGKALLKQGTGLHSADEIMELARECLSSISELIADKRFLFGDKPCSTDASLYGFLAQATLAEIETPINTLALEFPNLKKYCEYFRDTYYAEQ